MLPLTNNDFQQKIEPSPHLGTSENDLNQTIQNIIEDLGIMDLNYLEMPIEKKLQLFNRVYHLKKWDLASTLYSKWFGSHHIDKKEADYFERVVHAFHSAFVLSEFRHIIF